MKKDFSDLLIKIFTFPIVVYSKYVSPLFPRRCKYYPTCSAYALESLKRFGIIKGSVLAVWRLLRCNPWSMGGIDYVPEAFTLTKKRDKGKRKEE